MSHQFEIVDPQALAAASGGRGLGLRPGAAPGLAPQLPRTTARPAAPASPAPMSPLGPKAEGTTASIGSNFPNTYRAYGPDGAWSYFHMIDGKVFPGIGPARP